MVRLMVQGEILRAVHRPAAQRVAHQRRPKIQRQRAVLHSIVGLDRAGMPKTGMSAEFEPNHARPLDVRLQTLALLAQIKHRLGFDDPRQDEVRKTRAGAVERAQMPAQASVGQRDGRQDARALPRAHREVFDLDEPLGRDSAGDYGEEPEVGADQLARALARNGEFEPKVQPVAGA